MFPYSYTSIYLSKQFNDAYNHMGYVVKRDDGRFFCGIACDHGVINYGRYTQVILGDTDGEYAAGPVFMKPEEMEAHSISAVVFPDFHGASTAAISAGEEDHCGIFKVQKDRTMEKNQAFLDNYALQTFNVIPPLLPGLASPAACARAEFSGYATFKRSYQETVAKIKKAVSSVFSIPS
jgi:hypothetical protein